MKKFEHIADLLSSGSVVEAKNLIVQAAKTKFSRNQKLELAILARRAGLTQISMRILNHAVRIRNDPTPQEQIEYAFALCREGYFSEGHQLLWQPETDAIPTTFLYRAFSHILQWDYERAQPLLEKYLQFPLSPYERLVAQLNLISSWVISGDDQIKIKEGLKDFLLVADATKSWRLKANGLELMAQQLLYENSLSGIEQIINEASQLLDVGGSTDGFFVEKWRLFSKLRKNPQDKSQILSVLAFRKKARSCGYWEIARECDLYLGLWNRNRSILNHLYVGTPFVPYRKRILRLSNEQMDLNKPYLWRLNSVTKPKLYLDVDSGNNESKESVFRLNSQALQLLKALSTDFYRPIRISSIHGVLFAQTFFDPISTPNRIHKCIQRLRHLLVENRIPMQIEENGGFFLSALENFGLLTHIDCVQKTPLEKIRSQLFGRDFSIQDARKLVDCSLRTAQNILRSEVDLGRLDRVGAGPKTRYKFK